MKRASVVLLIALVAAVAARVAAPAHQRHAGFSAALACGVERWSVKTLKDRPLLLRARATTVTYLTSLPRPSYLPPSRRLLRERQIFSLIASVTLKRSEDDLDYHLVLRSGSRTMIAETPSPLCTKGATATRRKQMIAARKVARVCARARVVGVAFFDFLHGQTGVARTGSSSIPSSASPACRRAGHLRLRRRRWEAEVRRLVSDRLHPAAAARPELRRHPLPQLPRALGRGRPRPSPLRRRPRRHRLRDLVRSVRLGITVQPRRGA